MITKHKWHCGQKFLGKNVRVSKVHVVLLTCVIYMVVEVRRDYPPALRTWLLVLKSA